MTRKFLIDTDTASDDAVALLMALRFTGVQVVAITVVSGNVPLAQGVTNALYTVELCGAEAPVFAGAPRPMVREPSYADWFHGSDGMGEMNYPAPSRTVESEPAVSAIIETVRAHPGIEIVTLGPLTNIALAIRRAPDLIATVGRCVVMGGTGCVVGNVTPAAEFNIWADPEAADLVFQSGLAIEMVGWEHCRGEANLSPADVEDIRAFDTPYAHFTIDCNRVAMAANRTQSGQIGIPLPDPTAMGIALVPALSLRSSRHWVRVETQSELTRGMTVVDQLGVADDQRNRGIWGPVVERVPSVSVCWEFDVPRWKALLCDLLR